MLVQKKEQNLYTIIHDKKNIKYPIVSIGKPHCVIQVYNIKLVQTSKKIG